MPVFRECLTNLFHGIVEPNPVYLTLIVSVLLVLLSDVLLETDLLILPLNAGLSYYYTYARPYFYTSVHQQQDSRSQLQGIPDPEFSRDGRLYDVYPSDGYHNEQQYVDFHHQDNYNVYYPPLDVVESPEEMYLHLPQYVKTAMLFILGMTLFLFFASGMYSEKIGYANK
jgi:hypothetical protein